MIEDVILSGDSHWDSIAYNKEKINCNLDLELREASVANHYFRSSYFAFTLLYALFPLTHFPLLLGCIKYKLIQPFLFWIYKLH